jgi:hypothetical protein
MAMDGRDLFGQQIVERGLNPLSSAGMTSR